MAADVVLAAAGAAWLYFGSHARQTLGDALGRHYGLWEAGSVKRASHQARFLRNFEQFARDL